MGTYDDRSRWERLDESRDPGAFVRFLDRTSTQPGQRHPATALLRAGPGDRVLDLGCGTGEDVRSLSELVRPDGEVVGLDSSQEMISVARVRSASSTNVRFEVGSGWALPFEAGTFAACWIKRTLMHLDEPASVIAEAKRVLRPGGRLVAVEPDLETLLLDADDVVVTRRVLAFRADRFRSPWVGRQLRRLLVDTGFQDVDVTIAPLVLTSMVEAERTARLQSVARAAVQAGLVSSDEADSWIEDLARKDREGSFFCGALACIAAGNA